MRIGASIASSTIGAATAIPLRLADSAALVTSRLRRSMGISSNSRYQCVNGLERVVYARVPQTAARSFSAALRLANNFTGARLFMLLTWLFGVD